MSKVKVQDNKRRHEGAPQCSLFIIFDGSVQYLMKEGRKNSK
jgi:hypothetical protein